METNRAPKDETVATWLDYVFERTSCFPSATEVNRALLAIAHRLPAPLARRFLALPAMRSLCPDNGVEVNSLSLLPDKQVGRTLQELLNSVACSTDLAAAQLFAAKKPQNGIRAVTTPTATQETAGDNFSDGPGESIQRACWVRVCSQSACGNMEHSICVDSGADHSCMGIAEAQEWGLSTRQAPPSLQLFAATGDVIPVMGLTDVKFTAGGQPIVLEGVAVVRSPVALIVGGPHLAAAKAHIWSSKSETGHPRLMVRFGMGSSLPTIRVPHAKHAQTMRLTTNYISKGSSIDFEAERMRRSEALTRGKEPTCQQTTAVHLFRDLPPAL